MQLMAGGREMSETQMMEMLKSQVDKDIDKDGGGRREMSESQMIEMLRSQVRGDYKEIKIIKING